MRARSDLIRLIAFGWCDRLTQCRPPDKNQHERRTAILGTAIIFTADRKSCRHDIGVDLMPASRIQLARLSFRRRNITSFRSADVGLTDREIFLFAAKSNAADNPTGDGCGGSVVVGRADDLSAVFFGRRRGRRVVQFISFDHKWTPLTRVARCRAVFHHKETSLPATFD